MNEDDLKLLMPWNEVISINSEGGKYMLPFKVVIPRLGIKVTHEVSYDERIIVMPCKVDYIFLRELQMIAVNKGFGYGDVQPFKFTNELCFDFDTDIRFKLIQLQKRFECGDYTLEDLQWHFNVHKGNHLRFFTRIIVAGTQSPMQTASLEYQITKSLELSALESEPTDLLFLTPSNHPKSIMTVMKDRINLPKFEDL